MNSIKRSSRPGIALYLAFFIVINISADSDPAAGVAWTLWHPSSMGAPLAGQYRPSDPLSSLVLPHLHGLARDARLAVAGGGVTGTATAGGSVGMIVPGRRFVWNGALSLLGDDNGVYGRGVLALARPLGSRLLGGVGTGLVIAESGDDVAVGGGLDLGFRYDLGVFRRVSRVDLHLALLGIGSSVGREEYDPVVPAFTPVAGVRTRVVDRESLRLDLSAMVHVASFQRLGFDFGSALAFSNGPEIRVGWRHEFSDVEAILLPGLSLGVRIPVDGREHPSPPVMYGTVQFDSARNMVIASEFATGFETTDQEPPSVTASLSFPEESDSVRLPPIISMSPVGGLGQVEISVGATDNRGIREIRSRIIDERGEELRTWRHVPIGSTVPTGTFTERLVSDLWQRKITGTIYWDVYDGVEDGRYRLEITAEDRAGNVSRVPSMEIVVDGTPPYMEATVVPVSFDGEAVGERVTVRAGDPRPREEITVAPEQDIRFSLLYRDAERLSLSVIDQAGRSVVPLSAQPEMRGTDQVLTLTWPGTERDGTRIPEGVYRIRAEATDEYGNRSALESPPLHIQSVRPRFTLVVSDIVVAPTGDGNRDFVVVTPRLDPIVGLEEWGIELLDEEGMVVSRWSGIDLPPEAIILDENTFPSDGAYSLIAISRYRNGTVAGARTETIRVDTRSPQPDFILDRARIQPDIDPVLPIFIEPDQQAVRTVLFVEDGEMEPRMIQEWVRPPDRYDWQLLLDDGTFLEPGTYEMYLKAWDTAGNLGRSPRRRIELLERLEGVGIVPARTVFGPTGNGVFDTIQLQIDGTAFTTTSGTFSVDVISSADSRSVRRYSGALPLPSGLVWDGRDDRGRPVSDGTYRARISVTAPNRGSIESLSSAFAVDTVPPETYLDAYPRIVSPDGDGRQDVLIIHSRFETDGEPRYRLYRDDEEINARVPPPRNVRTEWEPRLDNGRVLPDGNYTLVLEQQDDAGNVGRSEPVGFKIDTRPVSGFIRLSSATLSGDSGDIPEVTITPVLPVVHGIERWEFRIRSEIDGEAILAREGGGTNLPEPTVWRGENRVSGGLVQDGYYFAELRARYSHGPIVDVSSPPIRVDSTPPEVEIEITPQPFSPDGDGIDDTVEFLVDVDDASPIGWWILEIFDPVGEFFYDVGGRGEPPRRIVWDGKARTGERVVSAEEYPWRLEVSDTLGNLSVKQGALQVDVLVEPFGNGYRIQLPSINFPPDSAELRLDERTDAGARNRMVLIRLVEILQRFPDYSIVVEGHAVNVSGTDAEHREELLPLSKDRADAVRRTLIELGVPARLLSAVGRGGAAPVVPHADTVNRWKNRRVDFILER